MNTRLVAGSTNHVGITPPQPLASLALAVTKLSDGTSVELGQPSNPSGDGLTWLFDEQSSAVPAELIGVPLVLTWTETALDGSAVFTAIEYVTPEAGLIGFTPKYTTLGALKAYGRAGALPGGTKQLADDDPTMLLSIARAEESIDCYCGTRFEASENIEVTDEVFVDRYGWLWCQLAQPIRSVSLVELMDLSSMPRWTPLSFSGDAGVIIDPTTGRGDPPTLGCYRMQAYPITQLQPSQRGRYRLRVTYAGGYPSIPAAIEAVCVRTAWWFYKVRDVPMGTVRDLTNATITVPQDFPADIKGQMVGWRRLPL